MSAGSGRVPSFIPLTALGIATAAIAARYFSFIAQNSVNVLFYDQWDYLNLFFEGRQSIASLFLLQHGPHREGLGLLADWILYPLTQWNVRAEALMIGGFIFAAMLVAFRVKYKLFGPLGVSDIAIPLLFLNLAQYETFIGTPNPAYSALPVLLIMLYCLVLIQSYTARRMALLLLLNLFLIFTGMGIFMGLVTVGVFALECLWRVQGRRDGPAVLPFAGLGLSLATLGSFFVNYHFDPAVDCFDPPKGDVWPYLKFIAILFANVLGWTERLTRLTKLGVVILAITSAVLAIAAYRLNKRGPQAVPFLVIVVLLAFGMLFGANAAVGRVCLGPGAALSSRYVTLLIPVVFGLYLATLSIPGVTVRRIVAVAFVATFIRGAIRYPDGAAWFVNGKRAWVACYLEQGNIEACDREANFKIYPTAERTRLEQKLDYLRDRRLNLFDIPGR